MRRSIRITLIFMMLSISLPYMVKAQKPKEVTKLIDTLINLYKAEHVYKSTIYEMLGKPTDTLTFNRFKLLGYNSSIYFGEGMINYFDVLVIHLKTFSHEYASNDISFSRKWSFSECVKRNGMPINFYLVSKEEDTRATANRLTVRYKNFEFASYPLDNGTFQSLAALRNNLHQFSDDKRDAILKMTSKVKVEFVWLLFEPYSPVPPTQELIEIKDNR